MSFHPLQQRPIKLRSNSLPKRQTGFSLFELILVLTVILFLSTAGLRGVRVQQENSQADAAGEQMKQVGSALNNYISLRYDRIIALQDAVAGDVNDPGPRDCDVATARCELTIQTLVDNGLLPSTFSGINSFGSSYEIQILRSGTAPTWQVDGIVMTNVPYSTDGVNVRYDLLGRAVQTAGPDAGVTRTSANQIDGYNGTWIEASARFPIIDELGRLAYRAGYGTQAFAAYLRIDGSTEMTGTLDLGGNDIVDVQDFTMEGGVLRVEEGTMVMTSPAPGVLTPMIQVDGTELITNGVDLRIANGSGVVEVTRQTAPGVFDRAQGQIQTGRVSADDEIWSNGNIRATNQILAGSLVYSDNLLQARNDVVAGRDLTVAQNATIGGNVTALGDAIIQNNIVAASGRLVTYGNNGWFNDTWDGGFFMENSQFIRTYNDVGIDTNMGEIRGGRIVARDNIVLGGSFTVGNACDPAQGNLGRDGLGRILNCVAGTWQPAGTGGDARRVIRTGTQVCGVNQVSSVSCNTGEVMMSGGHALVSWTGGGLNSPDSSYATGIHTWTIVNNGQGSACFVPVVVCQG